MVRHRSDHTTVLVLSLCLSLCKSVVFHCIESSVEEWGHLSLHPSAFISGNSVKRVNLGFLTPSLFSSRHPYTAGAELAGITQDHTMLTLTFITMLVRFSCSLFDSKEAMRSALVECVESKEKGLFWHCIFHY